MNEEDDIEVPEIMTKHTRLMNTSPEDFYNQKDSIYVKLTYFPEDRNFKFEVKNELITNYTEDNFPDEIYQLCAYIRGMVEFALAFPDKTVQIGVHAMNQEEIANTEGLSDEQKDLLSGPVRGSA